MTAPRTRFPPLVFLAAGLVLSGSLAACSGGGGASDLTATCDEFAEDHSITQTTEATVGDEITISLCSNPSTGFGWEDPVIGDPAVLEVVSSEYREQTASPSVVGAAGTQRITLRAAAAGASTVTLAYSRPWEGGEKGVWTYELTVTVR